MSRVSRGLIRQTSLTHTLMEKTAMAAAEGAAREGTNKLANAIGGLFSFHGVKKIAVHTYIDEIEKK